MEDDIDFNKEKREGKGWIIIIAKGEKGIFVSKGVQGLNFGEIGQLIQNLDIARDELVDISREILKRGGTNGLI